MRNDSPPLERRTVREDTPEDGANDGRDTKGGREHRNVECTPSQGHAEPDNGHASREQRRRTHAGNGSPDDQGHGIRSGGTHHGAHFEDDQRNDVGPLDVKVGIDLAKTRL